MGAKSTVDSHDESMEVTKDFQRDCPGIIVSINQANADYIVMMNRESKQNRGLIRTNNQIQVANKAGDILGTNATRTVGNAAKDACALILADWQTHGRVNTSEASASNSNPVAAQPELQTAPAPQAVSVAVTTGQPQASVVTAVAVKSAKDNDSVADAAKKAKQHKACLELAKDNPSITCN